MELEYPLVNLVGYCEKNCVSECCGIEAFELSPFHIASYLLQYTAQVDAGEVEQLKSQLSALKHSPPGDDGRVLIKQMNQSFSVEDLEALAHRISAALDRACELVAAEDAAKRQAI